MGSMWSVSVDDVALISTTWPNIVDELGSLWVEALTDTEANTTTFTNLIDEPKRLRFSPIDATPVTVAVSNTNPTLAVDEFNVVTVCLAGAL